jgi:hypothetical protein
MAFDDIVDQSDLDMIVVCSGPLTVKQKYLLTNQLKHETLPCPFKGLEMMIVQQLEINHPRRQPFYDWAMNTGSDWGLNVFDGGQEQELLLEFAICRQVGITLVGSPAHQAFGSVPRKWLATVLRGILHWHLGQIHHPFHDPYGHHAVLNACRAWYFFESNQLCSKTSGGEWALKRMPHHPVIKQALAIRRGKETSKIDRSEVEQFIRQLIPT